MPERPPTHFEVLGLPCQFDLDPHTIESQYLQRSRELHPDFHHQGAAAVQRASLEMTATLNEAYATLREPFRRADYLLDLHGGPSAATHRQMAPAFLEEMLELRSHIEELHQERSQSRLDELEQDLHQRRQGLLAELGNTFRRWQDGPTDEAQRTALLRQVREVLNTAKYLQGLLRDLQPET